MGLTDVIGFAHRFAGVSCDPDLAIQSLKEDAAPESRQNKSARRNVPL